MQGNQSLIGLLATKCYQTSPAADSATLTTWPRYSSRNVGGIDAIQLELGKKPALQPASKKTHALHFVHNLAESLLVFMQAYGLLQTL